MADSGESDLLILVDQQDNEIGYDTKLACHDGEGRLHRAFSIFIFDDRGRLLLQRRAARKRLWAGFWSNSCCSHPRKGESLDLAVHRRLDEELGLQCPLRRLYSVEYRAPFGDAGSEHELCWVWIGRCARQPRVDLAEVQACKYIEIGELDQQLDQHADRFTPWLELEWRELRSKHQAAIDALL